MAMLGIIGVLFVLVILSPFIFPNKKISNHEKDHI
jgi:hypothetical protein